MIAHSRNLLAALAVATLVAQAVGLVHWVAGLHGTVPMPAYTKYPFLRLLSRCIGLIGVNCDDGAKPV